jgi:hypothetical protein
MYQTASHFAGVVISRLTGGVGKMAERRMFAKTIVTSDAFLDMPLSARCLYFTLGMFADDDGFVNNPKSIMRQVGACTDDLNLLLLKRFILSFDSGVIVIKHWRIHNYIRNDRYKETKYIEEKSTLMLDEKGAYTELDTVGIPLVSKMDTQDRRGEERIGEVISFIHSAESESEELPSNPEHRRKYLGGIGKNVVFLSDEQMSDLLDKMSIEEFDYYVGVVADNELKGHHYTKKTHYEAILDMAMKDRRVKT